MNLSEIRENPNNPRYIEPNQLQKLSESINKFPLMMSLRPIIVDDDVKYCGYTKVLKKKSKRVYN